MRLVELRLKLVIGKLEVGVVEKTAEELLEEVEEEKIAKEALVEDRIVEFGLKLIVGELEIGVVEETAEE